MLPMVLLIPPSQIKTSWIGLCALWSVGLLWAEHQFAHQGFLAAQHVFWRNKKEKKTTPQYFTGEWTFRWTLQEEGWIFAPQMEDQRQQLMNKNLCSAQKCDCNRMFSLYKSNMVGCFLSFDFDGRGQSNIILFRDSRILAHRFFLRSKQTFGRDSLLIWTRDFGTYTIEVTFCGTKYPFGLGVYLVLCSELQSVFLGPSKRQLIRAGGLITSRIDRGELYRLCTSIFLHGDLLHLGLNTSAMWVLGRLCQTVYGGLRSFWCSS